MDTERRPRLVVELLPEDLPLVRRLKSRAALEGITVRELVLSVLREADASERETPTGSTEPGAWLLRGAGGRREALRASGAAAATETPPWPAQLARYA